MDASKLIDQKIASIPDWRGKMLQTVRKLIRSVDPAIVEEWKWMGSPVWNRDGILCVANAHSYGVRVTFLYGAKLPDPKRLFNSELEGNARRAIKLTEGDTLDAEAFKNLVRAAIAFNQAKPAARKPDAISSVSGRKPGSKKAAPPKKAPPAAKKTSAPPKKPAAKKKAK